MTPELTEFARQGLRDRGFRCLSSGKWGLPSYDYIEAWANGPTLVYLVSDATHGGWDILSSIENTNSVQATWAALDRLKGGAA